MTLAYRERHTASPVHHDTAARVLRTAGGGAASRQAKRAAGPRSHGDGCSACGVHLRSGMRNLVLSSFLLVASMGSAWAETETPEPLDPRSIAGWDHGEFSMGFVTGSRHYDDATFTLVHGPSDAAELLEPFGSAPYDGTNVFGLAWDLRMVVSYARMTVGLAVPYPTVRQREAIVDVGGEQRRVGVRSLGAKELRFGIGAELPIGPISPYVDLIGAVHFVDTTLTIDGASAEYDATNFALSLRAGARLHVRRWFFATASGELGLHGAVGWGAELSLGFAIP